MKAIQPFNRPAPIEREEYDKAIRSYVAQVTSVPGVRSVFTMGGIKAPGLSDIDMIVVGSRGMGDIEGALRGGVSHRVELLAKCPVLVVK